MELNEYVLILKNIDEEYKAYERNKAGLGLPKGQLDSEMLENPSDIPIRHRYMSEFTHEEEEAIQICLLNKEDKTASDLAWKIIRKSLSGIINNSLKIVRNGAVERQANSKTGKSQKINVREDAIYQDAESELILDIFNAVMTFDGSHGAKLSTWIISHLNKSKYAISAEKSKNGKSRNDVSISSNVEKAIEMMKREGKTDICPLDIYNYRRLHKLEPSISVQKIADVMYNKVSFSSLDTMYHSDDDGSEAFDIEDKRNIPEDIVLGNYEEDEASDTINNALQELPPHLRDLGYLYVTNSVNYTKGETKTSLERDIDQKTLSDYRVLHPEINLEILRKRLADIKRYLRIPYADKFRTRIDKDSYGDNHYHDDDICTDLLNSFQAQDMSIENLFDINEMEDY